MEFHGRNNKELKCDADYFKIQRSFLDSLGLQLTGVLFQYFHSGCQLQTLQKIGPKMSNAMFMLK